MNTTMSNPTPKTAVPIIAVGSVEETRRFYIETVGFDHMRGVVGKDEQCEICAVARDGRALCSPAPWEGH
jgi:hypothetical protein